MSEILSPGRGRIAVRLNELGIDLPRPTISPEANIEPFSIAGDLLYISGQVPQWAGDFRFIGKVGGEISESQGYQAARLCAINVLSCAHIALDGDFDRLARLVRVKGYVNASPDLVGVHRVVNGASDLFIEIMGDTGRHARTAVGVAVMPFGVAVEIEAVFLIESG